MTTASNQVSGYLRRKRYTEEDMYDSVFSMRDVQVVKALETIHETGKLDISSYWLLVVLTDGAGITFGKNQMTENGGNLWKFLFEEYAGIVGADSEAMKSFNEYKDKLYKVGDSKSKKYALTEDQRFKDLLVKRAQEDHLFRKAQDRSFHRNYFKPAVELSHEYDVTEALGLFIIYDMCIQSGPHFTAQLIEEFNNNWKPPAKFDVDGDGWIDDVEFSAEDELELERAWVSGLISFRHAWLSNFSNPRKPKHTQVVRKSAYRTRWMKEHLISKQNWDLTLPFDYPMPSKGRGLFTINDSEKGVGSIYNVG